jgi:catechol 2,3-dioxygenase-like lactoylglutathione lyase family enzyme
MITGLHHVQLAAPPGSEQQMREFYGQVLGLTEVPKPQRLAARGGVWFAGPGVELHIGIESPFTPARKAHPGLLTTDLDVVIARLAAAGYSPERDDDLVIPGGRQYRRCYAADPAGNRLEFLECLK